MLTAMTGKVEMLSWLLEHGADIAAMTNVRKKRVISAVYDEVILETCCKRVGYADSQNCIALGRMEGSNRKRKITATGWS